VPLVTSGGLGLGLKNLGLVYITDTKYLAADDTMKRERERERERERDEE